VAGGPCGRLRWRPAACPKAPFGGSCGLPLIAGRLLLLHASAEQKIAETMGGREDAILTLQDGLFCHANTPRDFAESPRTARLHVEGTINKGGHQNDRRKRPLRILCRVGVNSVTRETRVPDARQLAAGAHPEREERRGLQCLGGAGLGIGMLRDRRSYVRQTATRLWLTDLLNTTAGEPLSCRSSQSTFREERDPWANP